MGIFSGMEQFGLGKFENAKLMEKKKSETATTNIVKKPVVVEVKEEDILYDKRYKCPVCDKDFTSKCVRSGRLKLKCKDTDLRPIYEHFDPLKYDAIVCDKCGYASISRYYGKLSTRQIKNIYDNVGMSFKGISNNMPKYSYDDAIVRYKLALVNLVVKDAKNSEKAYTCLKFAWILRGRRECLDPNDAESKRLYQDELECIKNAYEGFVAAISSETFPIAGMDETTLKFVMAECARKLKRYEEALKLIGSIVASRTASQRVKNEALNLKDLIKADVKGSVE